MSEAFQKATRKQKRPSALKDGIDYVGWFGASKDDDVIFVNAFSSLEKVDVNHKGKR